MESESPFGGILLTGIIFGVSFGGLIIPVVIGILTPGRKGTMRTSESHFYPGADVNILRDIFVKRLQYEGFSVHADQAGQLSGKRGKGKSKTDLTHDEKPLQYELEFRARPDGAEALLTLWTPDLVFLDTGEGAYIDGMIHRLLLADQGSEPPPAVPTRSLQASVALASAILLCLAPLLALLPFLTAEDRIAIAISTVITSLTPFVMAGLGAIQIWRKAGMVIGKGTVIAAILLTLVALGEAAVVGMYALSQGVEL